MIFERQIAKIVCFILIQLISRGLNKMTSLPFTSLPFAKMAKCTHSEEWSGLPLRLLTFDFDGTCTVQDTTGLCYKATDRYRAASDTESNIIDKEWGILDQSYLKRHQETIERLLEDIPNTDNCHLNSEGLKLFLEETHKLDSKSTKDVESSGLLAGISKEGITQIAKKVNLKPGCIHVLGQIKLPLNVISFNWSKDLIQNVLGQLKDLRIVANNFPTVDDKSTGEIGNQISTSSDKEAEFLRLIDEQKQADGLSVYIGDSIGDLLPLLRADIGIVIGNSSTMRRVSKAFGIKLLPLFVLHNYHGSCHSVQYDESIAMTTGNKAEGVLYEAMTWQEIGELLLGDRLLPSAE